MGQKFRADINGLRALAVIAVVLFHFNPNWVPGGFAGVDVFFVISGFLMTGIIFKGLKQENFSILKFYIARANRIIPALALLCIILLVFGWLYLTPIEYKALGRHVASSIGFVSNIIYWSESGYFNAESHEKWLLHTWSLSAEWQFYIIYPLILVLMRKFMSIKAMKFALLISTIIGFIFSAIATYKWPDSSYYLLPTRAWEMMIGGIAYLFPLLLHDKNKKLIEALGLVMIVASYFVISENNPWPGYLAFFPVIGTFLVIQAQQNNSPITNNIFAQKIGFWSYSIYLWHWPVVVAINYFSLNAFFVYAGILLSIFLGFLSFKFIESIKFQNQSNKLISLFKCKPLYIALVAGLSGIIVFSNSDKLTPLRLSAAEVAITEQQKRDPREPICGKVTNGISPGCTYGEGPIKAIVIGDSHSQAQNVAIGNRATLHGGSIMSIGLSGCPTVIGVFREDPVSKERNYNCGKLISNTLSMVSRDYPNTPIIIINRLSQYIEGHNENNESDLMVPTLFVDKVFNERSLAYKNNLKKHMMDTICAFSKNNPVYLVRPTPELKQNIPRSMFRSLIVSGKPALIKIPKEEYIDRQKIAFKMQDEARKKCGVKLLDPSSYLCNKDYCFGDIDHIPLYFDDDHLSSYGSQLVSPIYDVVFK
ncbi:acyltransferase [Acinetobacter radioresistens]|uniref:acyltransferase family protein n=1 Tax=Acinetobacter radioresistens TaxID=40216 RepID=UPI0020047EE3|nr:acyltransferase family protein [Acinetobacter radioresistens]MCK4111584.1 acyltransferase [Acinetobacter radioresistens]